MYTSQLQVRVSFGVLCWEFSACHEQHQEMGSFQQITPSSIPNICERLFVKAVIATPPYISIGFNFFNHLKFKIPSWKAIQQWSSLPWLLGEAKQSIRFFGLTVQEKCFGEFKGSWCLPTKAAAFFKVLRSKPTLGWTSAPNKYESYWDFLSKFQS